MDEEKIVDEPTTEKEPVVEVPVEETPEQKAAKELEAKNRQLYARTQKAEEAARLAKEEVEKLKGQPSGINTVELIKASKLLEKFSNEEIDAISKFTGKSNPSPEDILKASEDPFMKAGIDGYRAKVEKERALDPSTRQPEEPKEKTFEDIVAEKKGANPFRVTEEQEKFMEEQGLWKSPKPRRDNIKLSS